MDINVFIRGRGKYTYNLYTIEKMNISFGGAFYGLIKDLSKSLLQILVTIGVYNFFSKVNKILNLLYVCFDQNVYNFYWIQEGK